MANQKNINSYPDAGVPATGTKMLGVKDNKTALIDYDKLADAVLNKLTNKNFGGLTTNAKNLIDGISELNTGLANVNADLQEQIDDVKSFVGYESSDVFLIVGLPELQEQKILPLELILIISIRGAVERDVS